MPTDSTPRHVRTQREKDRLCEKIIEFLREAHNPGPSFNAMAQHCGVSRSTLCHHFGDKEGALAAAINYIGRVSASERELIAVPLGGASQGLRASLRLFVHVWSAFHMGDVLQAGLVAGFSSPRLGGLFLENMLEPVFGSFATQIEHHIESGQLRPMNTYMAALQLVSPVLATLMKEVQLKNNKTDAPNIEMVIDFQVESFLRAWGTEAIE